MSQIKIEELSKTELKDILIEKKVEFASDAKHPELIDLVTKTLGTDIIDDGLSDPKSEEDGEAVKGEESEDEEDEEEDDSEDDGEAPKVAETPAEKKAREKAEKKAGQVKRTPGVYIVKANLKKDGVFYARGETVLIEDIGDAQTLIDNGTIE